MSKTDLRVDWATYEAAKYACENWHYSRCVPQGPLVKIGVWESSCFIGVVVFGRGANNNLSKSFNLSQNKISELCRVALNSHLSPVSRIVSIAVKFLIKQNPGLRLLVSYADPQRDHHGGIYQAMNWIYDGAQSDQTEYIFNGKQAHGRSVTNSSRGTTKGLKKVRVPGKHRYLMPLDEEMRAKIAPLAKPYPKRDKQAMADAQSAQRRGSADRHAPSSEPI